MKKWIFLAALCLNALPRVTHAQQAFKFGPRVGGNASIVDYTKGLYNDEPSMRAGLELGLMASRGIGNGHVSLQGSFVYDRKPFLLTTQYYSPGYSFIGKQELRLDYISLPLNVAYAQHVNGQGVQVFAGGYVATLLGGRVHNKGVTTDAGVATTIELDSPVRPGRKPQPGTAYFFKPFDVGVQAGLGYQYRTVLVQASYSLGLIDIGVPYIAPITSAAPRYYTRALRFALTYFLRSAPTRISPGVRSAS